MQTQCVQQYKATFLLYGCVSPGEEPSGLRKEKVYDLYSSPDIQVT